MPKSPNIAVPFVGALDTKSDSKMTPMGSLQLLENAIFTEHGNLKKRWGYNSFLPIDDSGASIEDARALAVWRNTPVLMSNTDIYAQSTNLNRWVDLGRFTAATVEEQHVPSVVGEQTSGDCISNGVITAHIWEDSRGGVRGSVIDAVSGFVYAYDVALDAEGEQPRCGISGGRVLLLWIDTTNNHVHSLPISNGDPAGTIAATEVTVDNTLSLADSWDVVYDRDSDRTLVCYTSSDLNEGLKVRELDRNGVVARTDSQDIATDYSVTVTDMVNLAICVRPRLSDDVLTAICVVGYNATGASGFYTFYEEDLNFLSGGNSAPSSTATIHNLAITFSGTTGTEVRVAVGQTGGGDTWDDHVLFDRFADTTNTLDQKILHSRVESKAATCAGKQWVVLGYVSPGLQHSHFLYDFVNREPVARIGYGNVSTAVFGDAPGLWTIDNLTLQYCTPMRRRISSLGPAFETDGSGTSTFENVQNGHTQIHLSSAATVQSVEMGDTTYISSGMLLAFDGVRVEESAPLLFPEDVVITDGSAGNLQSGSTYLYRVYYERLRTNGETTRSLALTFAHTVGGSDVDVDLELPTLSHTLADGDGDWSIAVYRTEADQVDLFYRVTSPDLTATSSPNNYVANVITSPTITFTDDMDDATLVTNDRDPQTDGVLPVVQPAGAKIIGEAADRVFLAGGEGRKAVVYPSLLHFPGEPVLFSDELQFPVEEEGGEITAMGAIDGVLVVFKERRTYAVSGKGPDDTGGATGAFNVQRITTDVGCTAPGSIVETPDGLMFQSAKGFYIIDRSFDTNYIGWPVEIFNDQSIVSAEVIPDTNLVVFLTSSGNSVAYDYFYEKWTTFTGHAGISAITVGGNYHYLRSDGEMYTRNESTYLDSGSWYSLRLRTAPIRLDSVQDYLQVRRVNILGEYLSSHKLQMKVFNNRDVAPFETRVFQPDNVLDTTQWDDADTDLWGDPDTNLWGSADETDYQFQHKFKRQKVQYLRLEFEDLQTSGASGQSYELSEMNFEVDVFDGNARLPAGRKL